jgi:hypothetical protein
MVEVAVFRQDGEVPCAQRYVAADAGEGDGEAAAAGRRDGELSFFGDLGPDDGGIGLAVGEGDADGVALDSQLGVGRCGGDEVVGGGGGLGQPARQPAVLGSGLGAAPLGGEDHDDDYGGRHDGDDCQRAPGSARARRTIGAAPFGAAPILHGGDLLLDGVRHTRVPPQPALLTGGVVEHVATERPETDLRGVADVAEPVQPI